MDTVRAENMSLYGYERDTTPVLRGLAQQGVVYQNAFSTAPWTLPSHASIFTGHWAHDLSVDWGTPLDDTYPTLAETLQSYGYITAGFVGNIEVLTYEYGMNGGFIHYEDYKISLIQTLLSASLGCEFGCWPKSGSGYILRKISGYNQILNRKTAPEVNSDAIHWIGNHRTRPYFLFINYYDAHDPYLPPEPFDTAFDPKRPRYASVQFSGQTWNGTPEDTQREENNYDKSILYLDHEIGVLIDQMRQQGLLENTLIVITSDHGEEFNEHQVMSHGNSLYRQSVQVPLMMIFPDHLPAGERVQEPVSLRDIPATDP